MGKTQRSTRLCRIFEVRGRSLHFIPSALGNQQRALIMGVMGLDPGFSMKTKQGQQ